MTRAPFTATDALNMHQSVVEEQAEVIRREEGKDEASRRQRVKKRLATWNELHLALEPETQDLEEDECDATTRIEEGDTFEVALEREVRRAIMLTPLRNLTARSIALRLAYAYDEEHAYIVVLLPGEAVAAERVYAHLLSYELLEKQLSGSILRSIARRATVLLLNRRFLAKTAKTRAEVSPRPPPEPAPKPKAPEEPELCLDCGRDINTPGPGCSSCEKTVS